MTRFRRSIPTLLVVLFLMSCRLGVRSPATAEKAPPAAPANSVAVKPEAAASSARIPAAVMTSHGADWLERPEREYEERPEQVLDAMALRDGMIVAEIGCGSGYFARRLARRVAPRGKVYAVDIQPAMLTILEKELERENVSNVLPVLGEESDPRLPSGGIDWILLVDVYHEFQKPRPMLDKIHQSLAKDGRVALVEYRLEGDSASHIRTEHRMSVQQVRSEWEPAGFVLVQTIEELPSQHLFIFRRK